MGDVEAALDQESLPTPQVVERPGLHQRSSSQKLAAVRAALAAANIISVDHGTDWDTRPPGIDPRRVDIPDLKARVVVQVADFATNRAEFSVLTNDTLSDFLAQPRPDFAKVRWMHVNGLSWDVLKPLALHYDLHPLSLEDILHSSSSSSTRSKADYYRQHLFCSVIVHRTLEQPSNKEVELPEEPSSVSRSTTKALGKGKGKGSKDRGGALRDHMGFHHHRRDEEAIVDTVPVSLVPSSQSSLPHSLVASGQGSGVATPLAVHPKSYSQYRRNLREAFKGVKRDKEGESPRTLSHNRTGLSTRLRGKGKQSKRMRRDEEERAAARWTVAALTKDVKVHIHVEQLSVFLMRDGTVLSVSQDQGYHHQVSNLFERLNSRDDILRESEDASFVLQALLDVTADDALEIVDEFREQLTTLESRVLTRPDMDDVRHLHILSSQLILLKSTLTPLQLLLQSLRSQDDAKAAAAAKIDPSPAPTRSASPERTATLRRGFVSHEARLYLSDVMDHMDSVLSSLDLFADLAENLIAFTFNNLSYSSNAYMQALSVVSIVFIPATFLSSFYGMNFSTGSFVDELDKGVSRFWSIALPVSIATTVLFGWGYLAEILNRFRRDFLRMWHRIQIARSRKVEDKEQ
ncbi:hypothetical protein DMC30DRAFT_418810 [Rhodotorula diobovata]|uniref:Uncharacterized protein n=1 Tax=Rhodotorula diobovata TaxID=5288 RepID=A0A5C5FRS7_9BASI|nr:hypothetical protein DMC30DRAFT_418810 [Rhodotorula diobovata]